MIDVCATFGELAGLWVHYCFMTKRMVTRVFLWLCFSIAVSRSCDVPTFGPPLPPNTQYPKSAAFVNLLLTKSEFRDTCACVRACVCVCHGTASALEQQVLGIRCTHFVTVLPLLECNPCCCACIYMMTSSLKLFSLPRAAWTVGVARAAASLRRVPQMLCYQLMAFILTSIFLKQYFPSRASQVNFSSLTFIAACLSESGLLIRLI